MNADLPLGVSAGLLFRAMRPRLVFGRGLLADASRGWGDYVLLTMSEPWEVARPMVARPPYHVRLVESVDRGTVERVAAELPPADTVVGLGGGMALDVAKFVAWRRGVEPVLIPSIASVDACVTNTIGVRDEGRVRYVGFVVPQAVLVDFDLVQSAPLHLNRAGAADILSIHTALWDWKSAANRGLIAYDEEVAHQAAALVDRLEALAGEICAATEDALRWLIEAYAAENALCLRVGHSRPEEGSEHFFAYNVEYRTGRGYIHGELVSLGILLMARLQENEPVRIGRILRAVGVRFQPRDLGLSQAEVEDALLTLLAYVTSEGLPYSVINERAIGRALVGDLCRDLQA